MSVMSVAMKQTIGIGTSITWSGWPAILAVERGIGLIMQEAFALNMPDLPGVGPEELVQ